MLRSPSSTIPRCTTRAAKPQAKQPVLLAVPGRGLHTFSAGSVRGCTGGGPGRNPAGSAPWGACVRVGVAGVALGSTRNSSAVSPSRSSRSCSAYQFKPCRSARLGVKKWTSVRSLVGGHGVPVTRLALSQNYVLLHVWNGLPIASPSCQQK